MYRVIKFFTDLQDNNHEYNVGDIYPHNKKKVSASRIKELSTDKNRRGCPLIVEIPEIPELKLNKPENESNKMALT